MYQLISAVAKSPDLDGKYYPINILAMPLHQVYRQYASVIVTVNHTSDPTPMYLDMLKLPYYVRSLTMTLPQWFAINGDNALPTTEVTPIGKYVYARFADVWLSDFAVKGVNRHYHPDMDITEDMKTDILLTKVGADPAYQAKRMVGTVNGYLHRLDSTPQGLLVYDGGKSIKVAGENQLGLIDFSAFGEIQTVPITESMIYSRDNLPLKEGVFLDLPFDLQTKTVFLVLGGYLHALDNLYKVVGSKVIRIDFKNLQFNNRYFASREFIDLSSIELTQYPTELVDRSELYSDTNIVNYLTLSQSFLIVLDSLDIDVGYLKADFTGLPGVYRTFYVPIAPMIMGDGRIGEYGYRTEVGEYAVRVAQYTTKHRILERGSDPSDNVAMVDIGHAGQGFSWSDGRFLMISKTLMEG